MCLSHLEKYKIMPKWWFINFSGTFKNIIDHLENKPKHRKKKKKKKHLTIKNHHLNLKEKCVNTFCILFENNKTCPNVFTPSTRARAALPDPWRSLEPQGPRRREMEARSHSPIPWMETGHKNWPKKSKNKPKSRCFWIVLGRNFTMLVFKKKSSPWEPSSVGFW